MGDQFLSTTGRLFKIFTLSYEFFIPWYEDRRIDVDSTFLNRRKMGRMKCHFYVDMTSIVDVEATSQFDVESTFLRPKFLTGVPPAAKTRPSPILSGVTFLDSASSTPLSNQKFWIQLKRFGFWKSCVFCFFGT